MKEKGDRKKLRKMKVDNGVDRKKNERKRWQLRRGVM